MSIEVSIIIPLYNSESLLKQLVEKIDVVFNHLQYEIVLVDDYSVDNTWREIEDIKKIFPLLKIKAIKLSKNFGQHNAILCGMKFCEGNHIITMDDDLEVLPEDILNIYTVSKNEGMDLSYACYNKTYESFIRNILTDYFHFWSKLSSRNNRPKGSGYRVISKRIADRIKDHQSEMFFIDEIVLWYTSKIKYVTVNPNPKKLGKSRYTLKKLFNTSFGLILISYLLPIRSVSILGGLIALVNFIIGCFFLYKKFFLNIPIEGYTSLIVSILFSTGIILLFLGVLAEYVSKILRVSSKAPNYFIDKEI